MWTYGFSDGYRCQREFENKDDMYFDIAIMITYHLKSEEPDVFADVLIFENGKLVERVNGEEIE
jgi:hypothetical protein